MWFKYVLHHILKYWNILNTSWNIQHFNFSKLITHITMSSGLCDCESVLVQDWRRQQGGRLCLSPWCRWLHLHTCPPRTPTCPHIPLHPAVPRSQITLLRLLLRDLMDTCRKHNSTPGPLGPRELRMDTQCRHTDQWALSRTLLWAIYIQDTPYNCSPAQPMCRFIP